MPIYSTTPVQVKMVQREIGEIEWPAPRLRLGSRRAAFTKRLDLRVYTMQDDCCKLDRTNPGSEMAGTQTHPDELAASAETQNSTWAWHPPLPLRDPPVFVWPPRPLAMLRFLLSLGFLWSLLVPFFAIATVSWLYLQPAPGPMC